MAGSPWASSLPRPLKSNSLKPAPGSRFRGMPTNPFPVPCCCSQITRRDFVKSAVTGMAVAAAGSWPVIKSVRAQSKASNSETLVASLYKTLSETQKKAVAFPFDHPLRSKVDNNWQITDKKISEFFNKDQQAMIKEIFLGLHSPEYAEKVMKQVEHDSGNEGFGGSAIALFGEPGSGKFEFVLT